MDTERDATAVETALRGRGIGSSIQNGEFELGVAYKHRRLWFQRATQVDDLGHGNATSFSRAALASAAHVVLGIGIPSRFRRANSRSSGSPGRKISSTHFWRGDAFR